MWSANRNCLTLTFYLYPVNFFSCLTAQARASSTILKSCGHSGQPCLVLDFNETVLRFLPLRTTLAVGLPCVAFIMLRCVHSSSPLSRIFTMKSCWILSETKFLEALIPDASEILGKGWLPRSVGNLRDSWSCEALLQKTSIAPATYRVEKIHPIHP